MVIAMLLLCLISRWLVDDDIRSCFEAALIYAITPQYEVFK